jgi:hypothetical protein
LLLNAQGKRQGKVVGWLMTPHPSLFLPLSVESVWIWIVNVNVSELSVCAPFHENEPTVSGRPVEKPRTSTNHTEKKIIKRITIKIVEISTGNRCGYQHEHFFTLYFHCSLHYRIWWKLRESWAWESSGKTTTFIHFFFFLVRPKLIIGLLAMQLVRD